MAHRPICPSWERSEGYPQAEGAFASCPRHKPIGAFSELSVVDSAQSSDPLFYQGMQ
jgi:hypothetical protein